MTLLLDPSKRARIGQEYLESLEAELPRMEWLEAEFVENRKRYIDQYGISQNQLSYLEELVTKYVIQKLKSEI